MGLANESDAESLVGSASDSSAGSEHSTVAPAPAPATKGGGRGRGKGRGHGDPAPAAAAAPAKGRGRGRGGVAVAAKQSKYTWVNLEDHTFTPRTAFSWPDKPSLGEEYDHLKSASPPEEWFKMRDAPDQEYHMTVPTTRRATALCGMQRPSTARPRTGTTKSATARPRRSHTRTCATSTRTCSSQASTPPSAVKCCMAVVASRVLTVGICSHTKYLART